MLRYNLCFRFRCIVENAIPKPVFHWYVDDEKLSDIKVKTTEAENTYTQTLYYEPKSGHLNKTLRCVIDHAGFEFEDEREDSVLLKFTEDILDIIKNTAGAEGEDVTAEKDLTNYIIGVLCGVFLVCLIIVTAFKAGWCCFKNVGDRSEVDAEKNNPGTPEKVYFMTITKVLSIITSIFSLLG